MQYPAGSQAVVLGGSMAGMLAARVLAPHFRRVLIIDQVAPPEAWSDLYVLLTRGHRIFDQLFPGIVNEWRMAGAEVLDLGADLAWRTPAGWGVRFPSGLECLAASRALIENIVRRRVAQLPQVEIRTGGLALSPVVAPGGRTISGVRTRTPRCTVETIPAELVVDASGRTSSTPAWLKQHGYDTPPRSIVAGPDAYASRLYRRSPGQEHAWRAVFIQSAARSGVAFPLEDNRWTVALHGGGLAPTSDGEFLAFAKSLPSGEIYNLLRDAEPLGPIAIRRQPQNCWRHYERLERRPEGLLVMGEAVCAFNPVYGQGITATAMEALALDRWLCDGAASAAGFQKELARIVGTPWALATGETKLRDRLFVAYIHRLMAASSDACLRRTLLEVLTMVAGPERLFRRDILLPVVRSLFSHRSAGTTLQPAFAQEHV